MMKNYKNGNFICNYTFELISHINKAKWVKIEEYLVPLD